MTVFDNLAFGLRNKKVPRKDIDTRVKQAADILDLDPLLKRKPKQLSGGQRQRVALGRAIVREPAAFLMDEPLSNLDAKLRVATRAEILKLQQRLGTTTIYVTHDQVEAMTMGDRIVVMNHGVLQQAGTPEELYTQPRNLFVAGFIGSPAMNLVPAGLLNGSGSGRVAGFRPEHVGGGGARGDAVQGPGRACGGDAGRRVLERDGGRRLDLEPRADLEVRVRGRLRALELVAGDVRVERVHEAPASQDHVDEAARRVGGNRDRDAAAECLDELQRAGQRVDPAADLLGHQREQRPRELLRV